DVWQIHEGSPINLLLIFRNLIDQPKLSRNLIASVAKQGEPKLVLVRHQEGLVQVLRRDGHQRRAELFQVGTDGVHGFHLTYAKRAPSPTNETEDEGAPR